MTHVRRAPDARPSSEGRVSSRIRDFFAHPWAKVGARAFVALVGLLILVLIGSNARAVPNAGPTSAPSPTPSPSPSPSPSRNPSPSPSPNPNPNPTPSPNGVVEHARRATPDDPVHLNSAVLDDLERLPSIGPKRAAAILSLRAKLGRFREVEDLMRVKGIGRATLKKLRPLVRLD